MESQDWHYVAKFTYARLGLHRIVTLVSFSLLIMCTFLFAFLFPMIESYLVYFLFMSVFFLLIYISIKLVEEPHKVLRCIKWVYQGEVKVNKSHIVLMLDNQKHNISLSEIKKYKYFQDKGLKYYTKNSHIIVTLNDNSKIHLYQSSRFGDDIENFHRVGSTLPTAFPNSFKSKLGPGWLHSDKMTYFAHVMTVLLLLLVIGIAIFYKINDFLFILSFLVLALISPHFILEAIRITDNPSSKLTYFNHNNQS